MALLYSGQPRHILECADNHRTSLHKKNPTWDIDIFAHIPYPLTMERQKNIEAIHFMRGFWRYGIDSLKDLLHTLWTPRHVIIEDPMKQGGYFDEGDKHDPPPWRLDAHYAITETFPPKKNRYLNTLPMFYSIEIANGLKCAFEKAHGFVYDCVVRMRSDIFFLKELKPMACYDLNALHCFTDNQHRIHDVFAFGTSRIMDLYGRVFADLMAIYDVIQQHPDFAPYKGMATINPRLLYTQMAIIHKIPLHNLGSYHWVLYRMQKFHLERCREIYAHYRRLEHMLRQWERPRTQQASNSALGAETSQQEHAPPSFSQAHAMLRVMETSLKEYLLGGEEGFIPVERVVPQFPYPRSLDDLVPSSIKEDLDTSVSTA
ncbi:MAG: hypothetical protein GDA54_02245 [Alphaproteobacteria bacterium GM7ARS4]|nr:hypothetical protein [Alphaproteobacteria bacterium GM7ARS4]